MVPVKVIAELAVMLIVSACVWVSAVGVPESFTVNWTLVEPAAAAVGVPLRAPVVLSESPAGRVEPDATLHVYGLMPPVAVSDTE
jgi:hypothetical protein